MRKGKNARGPAVSLVLAAFGLAVAGTPHAAEIRVPVAKDPADLQSLLNATPDRAFASDLSRDVAGTLVQGVAARPLPPGRYRLRLSMAIAPFDHKDLRDIRITVRAGGSEQVINLFDFPASDQFADFRINFACLRHTAAAISVAWALGPKGRLNRVRSRTPGQPAMPADDAEDGAEGGEDVESIAAADGMIGVNDLGKLPLRLTARPLAVEPLSPIAVAEIGTDKVLYRPGEQGVLRIRIRNYGDTEAEARIAVGLVQELRDRRALAETAPRLPATGEQTLEVPFTASGRWGTAAQATLSSGARQETFETSFSVAENFLDVGIGYPAGPIQTAQNDGAELLEKMPQAHSNLLEVFFWAPCDWSCLVSPLKRWWSGQTDYEEDEDRLIALVKGCHARGIQVLFYASRNAAGPFGWDLARRHPEWFLKTPAGNLLCRGYNVEQLDLWNDIDWRKESRSDATGWYLLSPDLRRLDVLDYGIDQVLRSAEHYGWDGVRFDGHYTVPGCDELSARNMRRLKERVWTERPDFRFGFNYGRAPEFHGGVTHEMREAMAGGGLYLQEGICNWRYTTEQYQNWQHYAANELRIAKQVQSLGGTYHGIWALADGQRSLGPEQDFTKLVYGLIAGGHSYYGSHIGVPGCTDWGRFMERWSGMLWDPALRVVEKPAERISIESQRPCQRFAQERVESPTRKFLILHLVAPPVNDRIAETDSLPPAPGLVRVRYRPEDGSKVRHTVLVRPETSPFDVELAAQTEGNELRVDVQMLRWAMLIWELDGQFPTPTARPRFTEPPDASKVADEEKRPPASAATRKTEPVSDQDRKEELPQKPAGLPSPRGDQPSAVLFVKGMFWKPYLAKVNLSMQQAYSLPDDYAGLYRYDAVVLCNVDLGGPNPAVRKRLRDYVEDGGRVVLLGGAFSLGQGGVIGTFVEDILPVTCREANEIVPCTPPLLLGPGKGTPWPDSPALFWRHDVTGRAGAAVLAWAGHEPIAFTCKFGKGLVSVFAGTTSGEADAPTTPFWETASWVRLFERLVVKREAP